MGALAAVLSAQADPLQGWLAANTVPLRSIDAADEDFTDLEPLAGAIGGSRVVMLGEPSHGAGSAFAAKVRIIKFLHQRQGFDVVAWESGLFDVRLAQAALGSAQDPATAAQQGILHVWSRAEEVRPLFDYARATQATPRPLEMAGIDIKASAPRTGEVFTRELGAFFGALRDAGIRREALTVLDATLAAFGRIQAGGDARPTPEDLAALQRGTGTLRGLLRERRSSFAQAHAANEIGFFERALANVEADGTTTWHRRCCDTPAGDAVIRLQSEAWNRRDRLMAENLRWLLDNRHRGRKVIVWAHNAHIMRGHFAADWRGVHLRAPDGGMTPMGAWLADALGDELYTIAFTTYRGEEAWANGQQRGPIEPAPDGSLEARLHALAKPRLFLNLRRARDVGGHPMRAPLTLRISGYGTPARYGNDRVPDVTRVYDAVLFIDEMSPATRIP
jgi:erythromycin esterase